ncbi:uncharacterized protein B0I36DRAFT_364138 [Microdochium trichocladiopsis]|uniref:BZIP domain-containing protein n=1 Tax=Microdochium trichocladiopsis TaxID=1682393 RepID=A0A9P9BPY3_9PEZI|nr:uncharacterized protein B0I36DRAFT_364138 [Microdochium trichocladiopsis]KAH7029620.1 hypothetical protein B0I36DRAFT_364138 [Microdochium trichocladiopsis]
MSDWSGQSHSLSCDKFGDMSWMPLDNASDPLVGPNQGFSMDLCSQQYDMPLQPFDTMQFNTLVPVELNTAMIDDAASSIHSWPNLPSRLPGAFSDAATASTHTSPDNFGTEPSSSRRHSYHQVPQNKTKSPATRSKWRASSSASKTQAATTTSPFNNASPGASIISTTKNTRSKKNTRREKNRRAATKYRNKTKKGIEELREIERQLSEKNRTLSAHVDCLRNEILSLKTEILRHGTCESPLVHEYIMKAAKQL